MVKKLRSLIHEVIPIDLRVSIDILSRRRDISNAEKQEELFKLLRQYNINDITPLGSGTNRYAFKLNGFVVKVATDHDGVIDNMKEFKMAKRLYPNVIKIYEVSANGTLLVCEYIQPFQSYSEMMTHADQIRDILKELSSVYLIGDVGITRKNYANWGLRVGSNVPVCLDFAYVYEVNSELFVCRYCKTNSMLLPNADFTELYCPAPGCGHKYTFEDIRAKLGNDIHQHEIGDLSEEGYKMTESNVDVELTLDRSNYLVKKKNTTETKIEIETESETPDDFFIPYEEAKYEEENKMIDIIKASASILDCNKGNMNLKFIPKVEIVDSLDESDSHESTVAFSSNIIPTKVVAANSPKEKANDEESIAEEVKPEVVKPATTKVSKSEAVFAASVIDDPADKECNEVKESTDVKPASVISESSNKRSENVAAKESNEVDAANREAEAVKFPRFGKNFGFAVSKFSSRLNNWLTEINAFDEIKDDVKRKNKKFMTPEDINNLYDNIQRAFYHAITEFCQFEKTEATRDDGSSYSKYIPSEIVGMPYTPTVIFIDRFFNDKSVWNSETTVEALEKYRNKYSDYYGLQKDFISILRRRLRSKIHVLDDTGISIITSMIADAWTADTDMISDDNEIVTDHITEEIPAVDTSSNISTEEAIKTEPAAEESGVEQVEVFSEKIDESDVESLDENTNDNSEDDEYDDDDFTSNNTPLRIDIHHDEIGDCVRLIQSDFYGPIAIPFYTNWDKIEPHENPECNIDDRNGNWEWLAYIVPDARFYTKNPDRWMSGNNDYDDTNTRIIILDSNDDNNEFLMGIYAIDSINEYAVDGTETNAFNAETVAKLNALIGDEFESMRSSHLARSVEIEDNIYTEEYMEHLVFQQIDDFEESEDEDDDDDAECEKSAADDMTEKELAAFEAILGSEDTSIDETDHTADDEDDDHDNEEITDFNEDERSDPYDIFNQLSNNQTFKPIRKKRDRNYDRDDDDDRNR